MENKNEQEFKKRKSWKKYVVGIVLVSILVVGIFFRFVNKNIDKIAEEETPESLESEYEEALGGNNESSQEEDTANIFDEEDDVDATDSVDVTVKSENYKINRIVFGGTAAVGDVERDLELEIYDIKSEIVSDIEDEEPKFLLSWKTNKMSAAEVMYSIDTGDNPEIFKEGNYSIDHSILLSDIELSTIYVYKIIAKDKWGNKKESEYFSMYTGEKKASVFDLIVSSIEDTFSWMMKK
jgi:hypothetical protein